MIKILIKGEALDLPEGFSMAVEDTNPIFRQPINTGHRSTDEA